MSVNSVSLLSRTSHTDCYCQTKQTCYSEMNVQTHNVEADTDIHISLHKYYHTNTDFY